MATSTSVPEGVPARENLIFMPEWTMIPVYALMVIAFAIMGWGFWKRYQVYRMGRAAGLMPTWKQGFKDALALALGQSRTRQKPLAGPMHSAIFYGFIVLFIGTLLVALDMDFFELILGRKFLKGSFYQWYELTLDVFGLFFIGGILVAAYRRTFIRPKALKTRPTDRYALWIFGVIGVTGYMIEALRLHMNPVPWGEWSIIGHAMAPMYGALGLAADPAGQATHVYWGIWWFHTVLVFVFIAMIPFTKLVHIATSTANSATRTQRPAPGKLSKPFDLMELVEKGEFEFEMGAGKPADFSWKQLLMADACTNCGRCEEVCPATAAGRPLSPRVLIQDMNHAAFAAAGVPPAFGHQASEGPGAMGQEAWTEYETACRKDNGEGKPVGHQPILGSVINPDTLWSCTTCRACEEACPVVVEHVGAIVDMRRQLMMDQKATKHQSDMLQKMATAKNPWGLPQSDRMQWAEALQAKGVKVHQLSETGGASDLDVVFWVGCSGASDPRNMKITQSMAKILHRSGLKWAVLGKEEQCTGDPARRLGEEGRFQELAFENIAMFDNYEIKRVVTTCPHCFNTLKNEYPDFGWKDAEVLHHTSFIEQLIAEGRIKPEQSVGLESIAYHDSCYIGRHNGIYDAPRTVLSSIPGLKVVEPKNSANKGRCCGAGGANMFFEMPEEDRMSNIRLRELNESGTNAVASNCPFCMTMFDDAKNNVAPETRLNDIAELIADSLGEEAPASGLVEDGGGDGAAAKAQREAEAEVEAAADPPPTNA